MLVLVQLVARRQGIERALVDGSTKIFDHLPRGTRSKPAVVTGDQMILVLTNLDRSSPDQAMNRVVIGGPDLGLIVDRVDEFVASGGVLLWRLPQRIVGSLISNPQPHY